MGPHRVQVVAHLLARHEAMGIAAACGKVAAGLALTLIGPFLATGFVFLIATNRWRHVEPPFSTTFAVACVVVVPLLLWYERRTKGRFQEDALRENFGATPASSYGEFELQKSKAIWTLYMESALLGPRLLWHVYDWARGTPNVHQPTRVLAAELMVELLDAGEGVPLERLARSKRSRADVGQAIRYLQSAGRVDVSRARDRVWLRSPTRAWVERALRDPSRQGRLPGRPDIV